MNDEDYLLVVGLADDIFYIKRKDQIKAEKFIDDLFRKEFNLNHNISYEEPTRYISKYDRYKVLSRQKWLCNFCHKRLKYDTNKNCLGEVAHIDHIHPFSKRDTYINGITNINELSNLQALCPECNFKKSDLEIN